MRFTSSPTKDLTSNNSSDSFHSIGTQLAHCYSLSLIGRPSFTFTSCQYLSPQYALLVKLSSYACFSATNRPPGFRHGLRVTVNSVTDWLMRHMTLVQTVDKNKIRHVIQCEEVSVKDRHTNTHTHMHTNTHVANPQANQC